MGILTIVALPSFLQDGTGGSTGVWAPSPALLPAPEKTSPQLSRHWNPRGFVSTSWRFSLEIITKGSGSLPQTEPLTRCTGQIRFAPLGTDEPKYE